MNEKFELLLPVIKQQEEKEFLDLLPTNTENVPIDLKSFKGFFEQFDNLELDTVEVFIKGALLTFGHLVSFVSYGNIKIN